MEAIILAGGLGSRLKSKVSQVPKPMAPVLGKPFLEHVLDYWISQNVDHFILSVGYLHSVITDYFKNSYRGKSISYSIEDAPLGTGGAFLLASRLLKTQESFLLLNGDTFLKVDLTSMLDFHFEKKSDFTLALTEVLNNDRYGGVKLDASRRCQNLEKDGNSKEINGGVYLCNHSFLEKKDAFKSSTQPLFSGALEKDLIDPWIKEGARVYGYKTSNHFIDIGTPEDYARSELFFKT